MSKNKLPSMEPDNLSGGSWPSFDPAPAPDVAQAVERITREREKCAHLREYAWCYHNEISGQPFIKAVYDAWPDIITALRAAQEENAAHAQRIAERDERIAAAIRATDKMEDRAESAERERDAMMEWARGKCETCAKGPSAHGEKCYPCRCLPRVGTAWTPAWAGR